MGTRNICALQPLLRMKMLNCKSSFKAPVHLCQWERVGQKKKKEKKKVIQRQRERKNQKIAGRACGVIHWPRSAEEMSMCRTLSVLVFGHQVLWPPGSAEAGVKSTRGRHLLSLLLTSHFSRPSFFPFSLPHPSGRAEYNLTIGSSVFQTWEPKWFDLGVLTGCLSGKMIVILNRDKIPLLTFGTVVKHNNQSPEDVGRIIGKYLGIPLKTV